MDALSLALGLTASASFIAGNYILNRNAMLAVQILGMTAVSIQYGLAGIWAVVAVNATLAIRNIILWTRTWTPRALAGWAGLALGILLIITTATSTWPSTPQAALPLLAAILNIAALSTDRLTLLKAGLGAASLTWLMFDATYGNWQNMIGDAFGVAAALIALIRLAYQHHIGRKTHI